MIVDYALGQPGSVHDAYAFQGMQISQDLANLIPAQHWVWVDSAYPTETWCVVPFKKPCRGHLTCRQNTYNHYLSKVHVRVEHAFATLKGHFQSLRELRLHMSKDNDLHVVVYWITTCIILHNMVIHFEERLGEETTRWAIGEVEGWDEEGGDEGGGKQGEGMQGQHFCGYLMESTASIAQFFLGKHGEKIEGRDTVFLSILLKEKL
ncbi:hypothetical protein PISMIDRAFT_106417 [Pisolithus microcarpus 441]|uniref:DDE Tnp4 domain-containing protein n=1 Tax=Pisolithus microcarpus 441 TaxID=765257 RepID=A0A0C9Y5R6_9AGAM|nr:hypothetical protein PISMIDRAFT_106417 [Pisolithus microcarpus 441]